MAAYRAALYCVHSTLHYAMAAVTSCSRQRAETVCEYVNSEMVTAWEKMSTGREKVSKIMSHTYIDSAE